MRATEGRIDTEGAEAWRSHLVDSDVGVRAIIERSRRVAVLGIKPESHFYKPAFYVADFVQRAGFEIIPVPVYYPEVKTILGRPVVRRLTDIDGVIDIVNVFRRPVDIPAHVDELLHARPRAVWMQLGIRHEAAAEELARAGIDVVQDRCLLVELRRMGR